MRKILYVIRATDAIAPSKYELILKELDTGLSSVQQLEAAEQLLDDMFRMAEQALAP